MTARTCYEYVVGKGGINPEYFKKEMPLHEVRLFINGLQMRDRTDWTTMRWLIWTISRALGGKDETPEDMVKFQWEEEPKGNPEEDAKALQELLAQCAEDNKKAAAE